MKVNQNPSPSTPSIDKALSSSKKESLAKGSLNDSNPGANRAGATVDISDTAKLMKQARDIARSTPEVRSDKVLDLKKRISEGNYKVEASKIADKLVEEHLLSDFGKNSV